MDAISATQFPVTPRDAASRAGSPHERTRRRWPAALAMLCMAAAPCLLTACSHSPDVEITSTRDATRRPGERPEPQPTPPPQSGAGSATSSAESRMLSPLGWGESAQLLVGREFNAVHFDPMSYELTNAGRRQVGEYANWLRDNPHVWLVLTGHSDTVPCDEFSLNLGMARATAVGEFMVARGIEGRRLFALSYGEDRPLYDAENAEAQRLNNRVEIHGFVAPGDGEAPGMVSVFGPPPPGTPEVVLPPPSIPMENETNH